MCPTINIPKNIYKRLAKHADGFDTPAKVIERLLNHYDGFETEETIQANKQPKPQGRKNLKRYLFDGETYGKGRLALAIIQKYVDEHPNITFDGLYDTFPKPIQEHYDVIVPADVAIEKHTNTGYKRHYIDNDDLINLSDCKIAVTNQWGAGNIDNIIDKAETLGYLIAPAFVCPECGHQFKGNSWGGIDAHWKANHEDIMPYDEAWPLIKSGQYQKEEA